MRSPRLLLALLALLGGIGGTGATAEDAPARDARKQMRGLDEQVQEVKSDVLRIASELSGLEERLLFPSTTQVAVFVSIAEGVSVRLDAVHVQIDGEPVAHHIYSFKELDALKEGGVQRLYTGNLAAGAHRLDVSASGKLEGGGEFSGAQSFQFEKGVEPKLVEIRLASQEPGSAEIRLGEW